MSKIEEVKKMFWLRWKPRYGRPATHHRLKTDEEIQQEMFADLDKIIEEVIKEITEFVYRRGCVRPNNRYISDVLEDESIIDPRCEPEDAPEEKGEEGGTPQT